MANEVFRDPAVKQGDSYRVVFNGQLCSPNWNSKGAAQAYLDLLESGARKPEYARRYWHGSVPDKCQLSSIVITTQFVDGKVPGMSSWGFMHPDYFTAHGGSYGTGRGQLYEKQTDGKWLKIAG